MPSFQTHMAPLPAQNISIQKGSTSFMPSVMKPIFQRPVLAISGHIVRGDGIPFSLVSLLDGTWQRGDIFVFLHRLGLTRYRAIIPALWGHGAWTKPVERDSSFLTLFAADLCQTTEAYQPDQVIDSHSSPLVICVMLHFDRYCPRSCLKIVLARSMVSASWTPNELDQDSSEVRWFWLVEPLLPLVSLGDALPRDGGSR
jgi:hypothetical protein